MALFIEAIKALPFFLLASELDLLRNPSSSPAFFGLCTSSDFRRSAEFERDVLPLRVPCLSLSFFFFASALLSCLDLCFSFDGTAACLCLPSLSLCFESDLLPQVPDRGLGSPPSASSEVVGSG